MNAPPKAQSSATDRRIASGDFTRTRSGFARPSSFWNTSPACSRSAWNLIFGQCASIARNSGAYSTSTVGAFYLEDLLGRAVDLVTERALRPQLRPCVERDAIIIA